MKGLLTYPTNTNRSVYSIKIPDKRYAHTDTRLDKLATGFGDGVEIPYLDRAVETTGRGVDIWVGGMGLVCFKFTEVANRRDKEEKSQNRGGQTGKSFSMPTSRLSCRLPIRQSHQRRRIVPLRKWGIGNINCMGG